MSHVIKFSWELVGRWLRLLMPYSGVPRVYPQPAEPNLKPVETALLVNLPGPGAFARILRD